MRKKVKKPTKRKRPARNVLVMVTKGKYCRNLTFWPRACNKPHSIAVYTRRDIVSLQMCEPMWLWNGSVTNPGLDSCVHDGKCQHFLWPWSSAGSLIPVKHWPTRKAPKKHSRSRSLGKTERRGNNGRQRVKRPRVQRAGR